MTIEYVQGRRDHRRSAGHRERRGAARRGGGGAKLDENLVYQSLFFDTSRFLYVLVHGRGM